VQVHSPSSRSSASTFHRATDDSTKDSAGSCRRGRRRQRREGAGADARSPCSTTTSHCCVASI